MKRPKGVKVASDLQGFSNVVVDSLSPIDALLGALQLQYVSSAYRLHRWLSRGHRTTSIIF